VSSANLLREHSIPSSRSLIKIFNRTSPSNESWGTPVMTGCQLDLIPFTTTLGLAIQPVFHPAKCTPTQTMSSKFLQEDGVGNSVKGLTKVQVDDIHSLSLIHQAGHLVIEGDQVGQAGCAFHEPMLAGPDPLAVLHMVHPSDGAWFLIQQVI